MTFKEFNRQAEKNLFSSLHLVIRQPKGIMSLSEKTERIGDIIKLYAEQYEKLTNQKPSLEDILEVLKHE